MRASMSDTVRILTRPILTAMLVAAFIWAALSGNDSAVDSISAFASMALGFWFGERSAERSAERSSEERSEERAADRSAERAADRARNPA